jgi:hypothetical protein
VKNFDEDGLQLNIISSYSLDSIYSDVSIFTALSAVSATFIGIMCIFFAVVSFKSLQLKRKFSSSALDSKIGSLEIKDLKKNNQYAYLAYFFVAISILCCLIIWIYWSVYSKDEVKQASFEAVESYAKVTFSRVHHLIATSFIYVNIVDIIAKFGFLPNNDNLGASEKRDQFLSILLGSSKTSYDFIDGIYLNFDSGPFTSAIKSESYILIGAVDKTSGMIYQEYQIDSNYSRNISQLISKDEDAFIDTSKKICIANNEINVLPVSTSSFTGRDQRTLTFTKCFPANGSISIDISLDLLSDLLNPSTKSSSSSFISWIMENDLTLVASSKGDLFELIGSDSVSLRSTLSADGTISGTSSYLDNKYNSSFQEFEKLTFIERAYNDPITFVQSIKFPFNSRSWIFVDTFPVDLVYEKISYAADLTILILVFLLSVNFPNFIFNG